MTKLNSEEFEAVFEKVVAQCRNVLVIKAREYATDEDRLHNFKKGAILTGGTPKTALWGFLTKHLVSLSDMVESNRTYTNQQWDEKIGDSINYLILLRALVEADEKQKTTSLVGAVEEMKSEAVGFVDATHTMITNSSVKPHPHVTWCDSCGACICHDQEKLRERCKGSNL
jgi:hypothetical protein